MKLTIQYFAILREQRGLSEEVVQTASKSPRELYEVLAGEHGFTLPVASLRAAVNDEFVSMDHALSAGDVVAFIAPVAGG